MSPAGPRSLVHVLADVALYRPKLVLTKGGDYWRIEDLLKHARRDAKSGTERDRASLLAEEYVWEPDGDDRVVVWKGTGTDRRPVFAEVGSYVVVEED